MIDAAAGRATGLHYGTFDYSAACGVSAAHQSMDHPAADHAKAVMQVAAAGTGVRLSDGSTNVLPVGATEQVHDAWRLHYGLVRRSLARAYYQGWDMHPGHLPTRYAAVYAFYREGLDAAAARLAAYVAKAGGDVMDEPATARALSGYLLRGLDCGAVDPAEVTARTGLTRQELDAPGGPLSGRARTRPALRVRRGSRRSRGRSAGPASSTRRGLSSAIPSRRRKSSWAALRPSPGASWATTVTAGLSRSASSKSSKPTSATGTGWPDSTRTAVTVTRLLPAKRAVTGSGPSSIGPSTARTRSGVVGPIEHHSGRIGSPAAAIASR